MDGERGPGLWGNGGTGDHRGAGDQNTTAEKQTTTAESAGLGHIMIFLINHNPSKFT